MSQKRFEDRHRREWDRLSDVLAQRSPPEGSEQAALPDLYRRACHHLALAKHRRYSSALIRELNQLVLDGHHRLYAHRSVYRAQWLYFFVEGFPACLRRNAVYVWAAIALFAVPLAAMAVGCYVSDELIFSILPPETVNSYGQMYDESAQKIGRERQSDTDWLMFGHYIQNNIGIAFRTFAGGIAFGLGSIFFLVFNGLIIGAVAGHIAQIGYGNAFFPFVIGHGAFELTAIALSGAAGLKMGFALVDPGPYRRLFALRAAARDAVHIIYGATLMLVLAAFLEAFWSSSGQVSAAVKYAVGAFFWLLVVIYCLQGGRAPQRGS